MTGEPPVGPCPPWCTLPPGHDWEDEWIDGLIRYHKTFIDVAKYHSIGIHEVEQAAPEGIRRMRELVFDVEAPTNWDKPTAIRAMRVANDMLELAMIDWPEGNEVR